MFTMTDIIDLAIQIEENGERVYRKAAQKVPDPSIAGLLLQLADEEVRHVTWFSELKVGAEEPIEDSQLAEEGKRVLRAVLGGQSFSLDDVDFSSIRGIGDLLRVAVEFEKDTVLFYEMIRSFVDQKEALNCLDTIIAEENRHIQLIEAALFSTTSPES
ncbi:MAG: ferritin family protein, partial [Thermodesulfobacteriota bacterium]|nr:ferritin family protein [Thermodesulfobacteriota bacterium]